MIVWKIASISSSYVDLAWFLPVKVMLMKVSGSPSCMRMMQIPTLHASLTITNVLVKLGIASTSMVHMSSYTQMHHIVPTIDQKPTLPFLSKWMSLFLTCRWEGGYFTIVLDKLVVIAPPKIHPSFQGSSFWPSLYFFYCFSYILVLGIYWLNTINFLEQYIS